MFKAKIGAGNVMTNFENNHRIMCVDASNDIPKFVGFIGHEYVHKMMPMAEAIEWLYKPATGRDTICPNCHKALFTQKTVIAAQGELYCSKTCVREMRKKFLVERMKEELDTFVEVMCEEVDVESIGIAEKEDN